MVFSCLISILQLHGSLSILWSKGSGSYTLELEIRFVGRDLTIILRLSVLGHLYMFDSDNVGIKQPIYYTFKDVKNDQCT